MTPSFRHDSLPIYAAIEHRVFIDMELRADREGPDAFGRFARVIGARHDRAFADLGEGLLVARPAKAAGHLEPLAQLERRIAEDRIFLDRKSTRLNSSH